MKTYARVQNAAGHPFTLPDDADLSDAIGVVTSGSNYIVLERRDVMTPTLPAEAALFRPTYRVPPSGTPSLFDVPNRQVPLVEQVTATPFTITREMIGINAGRDWAELDLSKIGWLRTCDPPFNWPFLEPTRGVYDPASIAAHDALINGCAAAGVQVIIPIIWPNNSVSRTGRLHDLPGDTTGTVGSPAPVSYTPLINVVNWFLNRYGEKIHAFESWNEPNVAGAYTDPAGMSGLIAYHNAVWNTVQAWNSANGKSVKVLGLTNTGWDGLAAATTYGVPNIQAAGGFANCDAFGYHIYRGGGSTPFDVPITQILPLRNAQAATAAAGKPLWITEFGDSSMRFTGASRDWWLRVLLYWFGMGAGKIGPYSWESAGIGAMQVKPVRDAFYAASDFLRGATVSYVNIINGGKNVAARVNGVDYWF